MTDDDLARLLRAVDPARTPVDAPLPLDAERRLREIVGRPAARRRRPVLAWTSAAAVVVLVFLAGAAIWALERRRNAMFAGRPLQGIGSGFWWAGVTTIGVGASGEAVAVQARGPSAERPMQSL